MNPGPSALEAAALTTRPTRRSRRKEKKKKQKKKKKKMKKKRTKKKKKKKKKEEEEEEEEDEEKKKKASKKGRKKGRKRERKKKRKQARYFSADGPVTVPVTEHFARVKQLHFPHHSVFFKPPKHVLTSNRSFLINANQAVGGACRVRLCSVFGSNQMEASEKKPTWQGGGTQIESKARGTRHTDFGCICIGTR